MLYFVPFDGNRARDIPPKKSFIKQNQTKPETQINGQIWTCFAWEISWKHYPVQRTTSNTTNKTTPSAQLPFQEI